MATTNSHSELAINRTSAQLALKLRRIAEQRRATGFSIPELGQDPDPDDPTNLWLLGDGRLRTRTLDGVVHEYQPVTDQRPAVPTFTSDPAASTGWRLWFNGAGALRGRLANGTVVTYSADTAAASTAGGAPTTGGSTSTVPPPPDPDVQSHQETYGATWARSFCSVHGIEDDGNLYYGRYSKSVHGERRIMIGFDDPRIRADLAGGTPRKVELHMLNVHAWSPGGVDVHFGAHRRSTPPGSFSAVRGDAWIGRWPRYGDGADWRTIALAYGAWFRDNTCQGITIDQPTSDSSYGQTDWSSIRLRISWTR